MTFPSRSSARPVNAIMSASRAIAQARTHGAMRHRAADEYGGPVNHCVLAIMLQHNVFGANLMADNSCCRVSWTHIEGLSGIRRVGDALHVGALATLPRRRRCRLSFCAAEGDASICGFAEFSSKWRMRSSHLRGGSYNRTVVQHSYLDNLLPLVTVAANLGELELMYPSSAGAASRS